MITELFQQALHINSPWLIKSIDFNAEEKRLDIQIDFKLGAPSYLMKHLGLLSPNIHSHTERIG